jgi:hypothetical protein
MTIEQDASQLLDPGERLIWSGKPGPLRYALNRGIFSFLFGLVFFGFAIFWTINAADQSSALFVFFGIPLLVFGLGFVLSPIWQFIRGGRSIYALTDRRAVIDISKVFPRRVSVPLSQIRLIEVRRSATGFGDVLFREIASSVSYGNSISRDGFIAIAEVDHVDQLLRSVIEKGTAAPPSP